MFSKVTHNGSGICDGRAFIARQARTKADFFLLPKIRFVADRILTRWN